MNPGVALGQRRGVLFGYDERVVRREGEQRGEEGFGHRRQLLARELQELFVPDAPVAVEIPCSVLRLVVLAAYEPLDACRTGIGPEAHRAAFRAAEEGRRIALVRQHGGQLAALAQRLRHQHERRAERGDASQHRRHGLDGPCAVGVHPFEHQSVAHQRVEEGREALFREIGVEFRMEERGVFGRHALHDENQDVASREVHGCAVGGPVYGRKMPRQLLGGELLFVFDASRAADGAQDAERVA